MSDEAESDIPALIDGPYRAPRCKAGSVLACAIRGDLVVAGLTDAPIPWPYTTVYGGGKTLIVTGQLADALHVESGRAIRHWWGVSRNTVWRWRRGLEIARETAGYRALRRHVNPRGPREDIAPGPVADLYARLLTRDPLLSMVGAAAIAGVHRIQLSRLLRGIRTPSPKAVDRLARAWRLA